MDTLRERRRTVAVRGADLAVFEYGRDPEPGVPTLLLVHGYPDDHRVYLRAIRELAATHHVVAFDTRNAGQSAVGETPGDFTLTTLADDVFAVLAAVGAGDVHLVGHDWGSIQCWAVVQDLRAGGLIGRYTSISGPDLRHFSGWIRQRFRNPRAWPELGGQLLRSWYIGAFLIPVLPEAAWRLFLTRRFERAAQRDVGDDPLRGLALYRTNLLSSRNWPPRARVTIPVQVVVPLQDPFVSPGLVAGLESWVDDLAVIRVNSGHWWPVTRPVEFAETIRRTK